MRFPRIPSPLKIRPGLLLPVAAWAATAVLISGCIFGGTGTDTENGVSQGDPRSTLNVTAHVVDTAGNSLAGVTLSARTPLFRPDSGSSADDEAAIPLDAKQHSVISDAEGRAVFKVQAAGTYVVEGSRDGNILFYDTLKVGEAAAAVTFKARAVRSLQGKVRLASGMRIDSGKVFIRGTRKSVNVGADGAYDLGSLPVDIAGMAIGMRFTSSPTIVLEVDQILVKRDTAVDSTVSIHPGADSLKLVYTCKDLPKDSAYKISNPLTAGKPDSTAADSGTASGAPITLDSSRVDAALHSCDSIPEGAVVNLNPVVNSEEAHNAVSDSVSGPVLIPRLSRDEADIFTSAHPVISYTRCVDDPGNEKVTFNVQLVETIAGSSLLVGDLTSQCVKP